MDQVQKSRRHVPSLRGTELLMLDRGQPRRECERCTLVDHEAHALAQQPEELGALDHHFDPRAEAARQAAVQHVT